MICILVVLKDTTTQLDFRVTTLEEIGGSGNSSIGELEVRVETLEANVSDHETKLTTAESQLEGISLLRIFEIHLCKIIAQKTCDIYPVFADLQNVSDELETRVTSAEENIQGK